MAKVSAFYSFSGFVCVLFVLSISQSRAMSSEDCPGLTAYVGECDSRCADRCVAQHKQDYLGSWCQTNFYGTSYCMCCIVPPPDDDGYYWLPTTMPPAKAPQAPQGVEPVASQAPLVSSGVEPVAPPQSPPTSSGIEPATASHTPPPCSPNVEYVAPRAHHISPSAEPMAPTPQTPHSTGVKPAETPETLRHSGKGQKHGHHHSKVIHH